MYCFFFIASFATIVLSSDSSTRKVMEALPSKSLHGEKPVVTYCNRQTLNQFEQQARKGEPPQNGTGKTCSSLYLKLVQHILVKPF